MPGQGDERAQRASEKPKAGKPYQAYYIADLGARTRCVCQREDGRSLP